MKFNLSSILFLLAIGILGCKSGDTKLPSGFDYKVIQAGKGDVPKVNDYVFFTIKITDEKGKVLQEMKEGPQMPVMQILQEMPKHPMANPVLELLAVSKVDVYKRQDGTRCCICRISRTDQFSELFYSIFFLKNRSNNRS